MTAWQHHGLMTCSFIRRLSHARPSAAATNFANIELPMGGKISSADANHIELVIPRIQLFDVWLQPRALAKLRCDCSRSGDCVNTKRLEIFS